MDYIVFPIAFLARHRFAALMLLLFVPLLISVFRNKPESTTSATTAHFPLIALIVLYVIANMFVGDWLASSLVNSYGTTGKATVTAEHGTSSTYNNQRIYRYDVLITTADTRPVETSFESDDFNIYPYHNSISYPSQGDLFNVRYLSHFPATFVILSNDDSPWATGLRCHRLQELVSTAESKHLFAPNDPTYRRRYHDAMQTILIANCPLQPELEAEYRNNVEATADTP